MSIESLLRDWDGETVVIRHDKPTGAWIFIAIHSTRLGLAGGGTRMKSYPTLEAAVEDALRLSRAMTYKWAIPGLAKGGGKAVIAIPPDLDAQDRPGLLRRYGALVRQLGGLFVTGPDVGTSSEDMDVIAETGSPHVFGLTPAAGGPGSSGPITGLGVFAGIEAACEHAFGDASLKGRHVLVQGVGGVGATLIQLLRDAGATVSFSDVADAAVHHFRDEVGLRFVPPEEVYATECDVFAPCALGAVLNAATIPGLRCRIVAGGANNQLATPEDGARLHARGILYAPDYVINAGGAMGLLGMANLGWTHEQAEREVAAGVRRALRDIFAAAAAEGITTEAAADRIAEERLSPAR